MHIQEVESAEFYMHAQVNLVWIQVNKLPLTKAGYTVGPILGPKMGPDGAASDEMPTINNEREHARKHHQLLRVFKGKDVGRYK